MKYIRKIIFGFAILGCALFMSPSASLAANVSSSTNWSGYVAENDSNYSAVSGTWTIPSIAETTSFVGDVTWVGIGGVSTSDLIQVGTQTMVENGQTSYQAWYEMLPQDSETIPVTVRPGDSVHVSLSEQGLGSNEWLISFVDNTTGQNYQTTVSYTSSLSSAEWIEEMPTISLGNFTARGFGLDNFGIISFTNCLATQNGNSYTIAQNGAQAVSMFNANNQILATPSALGSDGASFSVTRSSITSNSSTSYQYTPTGPANGNSLPGRHRGQLGNFNFFSRNNNGTRINVGTRGFMQMGQYFGQRNGLKMNLRKSADKNFR
jgi:hypothetical protein